MSCSPPVSAADFDLAMKQASEEFAPRLIVRAIELLLGGHVDPWELLARTPYDKSLERPYPETREVLSVLASRFQIGVIANQSVGTEDRLRSYGLLPSISACCSSTEEGLAKPDPAFFKLAISRAGCHSAEAVMVGDRLDNDIAPAKQLGWKTIRVLQGYGRFQQPRSDHETPDHTVNSLSELPGILMA